MIKQALLTPERREIMDAFGKYLFHKQNSECWLMAQMTVQHLVRSKLEEDPSMN